MLRSHPIRALLAALALAITGIAAADQSPPSSGSPAPGAPPRGANRELWQACHKQADDQKLARGEARREFMRSCMKGSQPGAAS
jgi:hypothetical protein